MTPDQITPEWIASLKALCEKASKGPWHAGRDYTADIPIVGNPDTLEFATLNIQHEPFGWRQQDANAAFIAAARDALPVLLEAFEAATETSRQYREAWCLAEKALTAARAAQDEREAKAGEACGVPRELHGCDWPDGVAEEVATLKGRERQTFEAGWKMRAEIECHKLSRDEAFDVYKAQREGAGHENQARGE